MSSKAWGAAEAGRNVHIHKARESLPSPVPSEPSEQAHSLGLDAGAQSSGDRMVRVRLQRKQAQEWAERARCECCIEREHKELRKGNTAEPAAGCPGDAAGRQA